MYGMHMAPAVQAEPDLHGELHSPVASPPMAGRFSKLHFLRCVIGSSHG